MSKCSVASHKGDLSGALPELATIISCRLAGRTPAFGAGNRGSSPCERTIMRM